MKYFLTKAAYFAIAGVLTVTTATAASLPKASEIQSKMGMGFNIGNSMEVPNNPTAWGNPFSPHRPCSIP